MSLHRPERAPPPAARRAPAARSPAGRWLAVCLLLLLPMPGSAVAQQQPAAAPPDRTVGPLSIEWEKNYLTVDAPAMPGGPIRIHYLEAYCRAGSTDREWRETVIPHQAELVATRDDGRTIEVRDTLADGLIVKHTIRAAGDEVDFRIEAHNPTDAPSAAHWAQPCMRVDRFTGCGRDDARAPIPAYARKCFIFLDGKLTRLPTEPWADQARYTFGQVYCPAGVPRDDVNPRPLSRLVPSSGLTGCFSADERHIVAVAWEPYQELFQGVIACMHSDFRLGGVAAGETKHVRGKLYVVPADVERLVARYERDFPRQAKR